jgi:ArsR family transcriptional regulator, arsenate/arsenite/antimonite-responsive transcriptional repressor
LSHSLTLLTPLTPLAPLSPRSLLRYHCIQYPRRKISSMAVQVEEKVPAKPARISKARQVAILKALADPRRYELLERIAKAGCPLGCAQALAALPISAATLSHHIKELETAGLIEVRREGKFAYLSLKPGVLTAVAAILNTLETKSCVAG